MVTNRNFLLFVLAILSYSTFSEADVPINFAFDYRLTYQISAGRDITTNELVVQSGINIGSPAAKRAVQEDHFKELPYRTPRDVDDQTPPEYGYASDPIYDDADLERFVGMDAHPTAGTNYLLTTNSSIYTETDRTILHLSGCSINKKDAWSISFDPVTRVLHVFSSKGVQYLVNVSTGECTSGTPVRNASIVGSAYAVNTVARTYTLYALDKISNSFGTLNPNTGVFTSLKVVVGHNVSDYFFDAAYFNGTLKVLFAKGQIFYNFNVKNGQLSAGYDYQYGRDLLAFCFPATNFTGIVISPSYGSSSPPTTAPVAPTKAATTAPTRPATAAPTRPATAAPTRPATAAPTRPATAAPTRAKAATAAPTKAATSAPKVTTGARA